MVYPSLLTSFYLTSLIINSRFLWGMNAKKFNTKVRERTVKSRYNCRNTLPPEYRVDTAMTPGPLYPRPFFTAAKNGGNGFPAEGNAGLAPPYKKNNPVSAIPVTKSGFEYRNILFVG
jgi:hypothetical protein